MNFRGVVAALLLAGMSQAVLAAEPRISHTPLPCIRGERVYALAVAVEGEGELRLFYRKANSTWCTVIGTNRGVTSWVAMPKLSNGDEIEYFLVLVQGKRVVARSEHIYQAKVDERCEAVPIRLLDTPPTDCSTQSNLFGESQAAGYALPLAAPPAQSSPDRPS